MNDKLKTFEAEMEREKFEKNLAEVQGIRQKQEEAELEEELGDHIAATGSEMSELAKRVGALAQKARLPLMLLWPRCP